MWSRQLQSRQSVPVRRAYLNLCIFIAFAVALYFSTSRLIESVVDAKKNRCQHVVNSKPNTTEIVILNATNSSQVDVTSLGYNSSGFTNATSVDDTNTECLWWLSRDVIVYVGLVTVLFVTWFILTYCVCCVDCEKRYDVEQKKKKEKTHPARCQLVGVRSDAMKIWLLKRKLKNHAMLSEMSRIDLRNDQSLGFMKLYNFMSTLQRDVTTKSDRKYVIVPKRVFRIQNNELWRSFHGDKRPASELVESLVHTNEWLNCARKRISKTQQSMTSSSSDDSDDDNNDVTRQSTTTPLLLNSQAAPSTSTASARQLKRKLEQEDCVFLFHGTHIENALDSIENGLHLQAEVKDNYFGHVLPLSESIYRADAYTNSEWYPRNRDLLVFIVRTSLTKAYRRLHNEHVPATIRNTHTAYVDGNDVGHRQVLVFDTKYCYAEYAVLYERVHKNVFWQQWSPGSGASNDNNNSKSCDTYV